MDLALLFFLPLLGGYFFVRSFVLTRYQVAHEDTGRTYYRAALAGLGLAVVATLLHIWTERSWPDYAALVRDAQSKLIGPMIEKADAAAVPASAPASWPQAGVRVRATVVLICVWALLLGLLAVPLLNALVRAVMAAIDAPRRLLEFIAKRLGYTPRTPRVSAIERLNRRAITDELEGFLYDALLHGELVQVTLDNHKVYVGVVRTLDPIGPAKHFTMQPFMSGGRDASNRDVLYTTHYDRITKEAFEAAGVARREQVSKRFRLIFPLARLVSVSGFDLAAYRQFELARLAAQPVRPRTDWAAHLAMGSRP